MYIFIFKCCFFIYDIGDNLVMELGGGKLNCLKNTGKNI